MSKTMIHLKISLVIARIVVHVVIAQKNLAPEGTTSQSTYFHILNCPSESAVTGNASHAWIASLCTCTHTNTNQRTAWWRDNFSREVYVTNLIMYFRENYGPDLYGFEFYITNSSSNPPPVKDLCYMDTGTSTNYPDIYQEIHCNKIGRSVVFYIRRPNPLPARAFAFICYLEIRGCWRSFWGQNCSIACPEDCINQHCYPENGTCVWGCDSTKCLGDICDRYTSVCTHGCTTGRIGRYCNKNYINLAINGTATQNPSGSFPAKLAIDGNRTQSNCAITAGPTTWLQIDLGRLSIIKTVYLTFGESPSRGQNHIIYASNTSDYWTDGTVLYKGEEFPEDDITIFSICRYVIYIAPTIIGVSDLHVCEIEIGGCPVGKYGPDCSKTCPANCGGPCDVDTGNCIFGCMDGWIGDMCDKVCDNGYFGNQCKEMCSPNCLSPPCYHVTGECINGDCKKGWKGTNCVTECSHGYYSYNCSKECQGCVNQECDRVEGICSNVFPLDCNPGWQYGPFCNESCDDGYYGHNCTQKCHCSMPCNKETGYCSGYCLAGRTGTSCDIVCSSDYYGVNCAEKCGGCFNLSCNVLTGICTEGCMEGYMGHKCRSIGYSIGEIVGSSIGCFVLGVALTLAVGFGMMKARSKTTLANESGNKIERQGEQSYETLGMEGTSYANYKFKDNHMYDQIKRPLAEPK